MAAMNGEKRIVNPADWIFNAEAGRELLRKGADYTIPPSLRPKPRRRAKGHRPAPPNPKDRWNGDDVDSHHRAEDAAEDDAGQEWSDSNLWLDAYPHNCEDDEDEDEEDEVEDEEEEPAESTLDMREDGEVDDSDEGMERSHRWAESSPGQWIETIEGPPGPFQFVFYRRWY